MNLSSSVKGAGECRYAINLHPSDDRLEPRRGGGVWGSQPVSGASWYSCNGGMQFVFSRTAAGLDSYSMVVVGADNLAAPSDGGLLYRVNETSDPTVAPVALNTTAGITYPTGSDAKYGFAPIHGNLYGINGYCKPFAVAPGTGAFSMVALEDRYPGDLLHICYKTLPVPRMIGSFNNALIIGNFRVGDTSTTTQDVGTGSVVWNTVTVGEGGPLTVWKSEAITDLEPTVAIQVKEFFTFSEASGQQVVGQIEFRDKNLFFLSGSVWQIVGDLWSEAYAVPISRTTGCVAAGTIKETPYGVVWMANDGFYLYDGQNASKISDSIDPIMGEMLYSYDSNPYLLDQSKLWDACAVVDVSAAAYSAYAPLGAYSEGYADGSWGPMLKFVWNYENKAWSIGGKGCFTASGAANTDEWGENARAVWMHTDASNNRSLMFAGADGCVHKQRTDGKDFYLELTSSAGSTSSVSASFASYAFLNTTDLNDFWNGAVLTILDDRTTAEQVAGTWTNEAGRNAAGTSRTVTDTTVTETTVAFTVATIISPQVGCKFSLHWPIRHRLIDEYGTENPDTVKVLRCLQPRVSAETNSTMLVRYDGNPLNWNPDTALNALDTTKTITLSNANTSAVTDKRINCGPRRNTGRKIMYALEYFGDAGFTVHSCMVASAVKGYK